MAFAALQYVYFVIVLVYSFNDVFMCCRLCILSMAAFVA